MLESLFPTPRWPILCVLFGKPERWWAAAEIADRAGMSMEAVRQYVAVLREAGLVRERSIEGRSWFQTAPDCPIRAELQSIVAKLAPQPPGETILVVEDQFATARITRILLESWGYRVLEAHGAAEAIALFETHGGRVEMLLTDVIMPEMNGPELADTLRKQKPELRVVFMSGYPAGQVVNKKEAFLAKPFNPASLLRAVRTELERLPGRSPA